MRASLASLTVWLTIACPAWAGDLTVSLHTPAGQPVAEAVVMVVPGAGTPKGPIRFSWPYRMAQRDLAFTPFVLVVPVGAEVAFPNLDPILHHVYSFSPVKKFELKLYGRDETRLVKFERPGVVSVGCNIHDDMTGFIRVVDTPWAAKTNGRGEVTLTGLPAGSAAVTLWHPYLKAPRGEMVRAVAIPSGGAARLDQTLDLRPAPLKHGGY
ncbi:MAG TPA: methylamine utilization protein [Phenylobacterium sp.]|nr:methylamine utilization protein [Phenylobacterium sp.]